MTSECPHHPLTAYRECHHVGDERLQRLGEPVRDRTCSLVPLLDPFVLASGENPRDRPTIGIVSESRES